MSALASWLALVALGAGDDVAHGRWEVRVVARPSGAAVTVHAERAPALPILREIARASELELVGVERLEASEPLTAYLDERPLETTLAALLGSVGMRATIADGVLTVEDELPPFPERAAVDSQAELALLRALKCDPEHREADRAELALAEIAERRGDHATAVKHYEYLARVFPESPHVPGALWSAAQHLARAREWSRAAARLTELAEHPAAHEHRVRARVELARVHCFLEGPKKALYILDALDHNYPAKERGDQRARMLVRARALALAGEPVQALRTLDALPEASEDDGRFAQLEVRALALERCGKPSDAALAWLSFAKTAPADLRDEAIESAARSALAAEDEVGVLLIEAWAQEIASAADLSATAADARMRLGLTPPDPTDISDEHWLARGEEMVARGAHAEAVRALEPLYHRRARLGGVERRRLAKALARALEAERRLGYAITVLREIASSLDERSSRAELYVLASELYEANGRYEDAVNALEGKL